MLQPHTYPRLLGQALTLEPQPFVEMVDDDNPWIEGLFFTFMLGLLVAAARLIGGWLMAASLPQSEAILETLVIALKQGWPATTAQLAAVEASLRQAWPFVATFLNLGNSWLHLLVLIVTPLSLIGQWLAYALISHAGARMLGGKGRIGQTLGAVALGLSPRILLVATVVPFVSVSGLLLHVWGILIAYRGLEVAHDLPPLRAAIAALLPLAVVGLLLLLAAVVALGASALRGGGL